MAQTPATRLWRRCTTAILPPFGVEPAPGPGDVGGVARRRRRVGEQFEMRSSLVYPCAPRERKADGQQLFELALIDRHGPAPVLQGFLEPPFFRGERTKR